MNRTDFTHTGGLPLTQDVLDFLQQSYQNPFEGLARFIGGNDLVVLAGCVQTGTTMSDGWIVYQGENTAV